MEVIIQKDYKQMSKAAAEIVVEVLNAKPNAVLGMATGSTPLGLYQELVRLHKEEQLDFSHVTTFHPITSTFRPAVRATTPLSVNGMNSA